MKNTFRSISYLHALITFTISLSINAMDKNFTCRISSDMFQGYSALAYNDTLNDYFSRNNIEPLYQARPWQPESLHYPSTSRVEQTHAMLSKPYNPRLEPIYKMYLNEDTLGLSAKKIELTEQYHSAEFGLWEIHEQVEYIDQCLKALQIQEIKREQFDSLHQLYRDGNIEALESRKTILNEQLDKGEITSQAHKEQIAYIDKCVQDLNQQKAQKEAIYEKSEECFTPSMKNVSDQHSSKLRIILSTGDKDKLNKAMRMVINKSPGGLEAFFLKNKRKESDRYYDLASQTETLQQLETTKLLFDVMNGDVATAQKAASTIATRKMNRTSQEFIDFDPIKVAQEILAARQMQKATIDNLDMVSTPAYNRISSINPEVDQRIAEALSKIDKKTIDDLSQFLDAVGQVLNDMTQQGLLKPEEQINALVIVVGTYLQNMADVANWKDSFVEFVEQQGQPMREVANTAYKDFCEKNPELNLPEHLDYGNIEKLDQIISLTIDQDANLSPEKKAYVDKAKYLGKLTRTGCIYAAFLYASGKLGTWESSSYKIPTTSKPLDYGHSAIQYQELKTALQVEEHISEFNHIAEKLTSVIKCTTHGLERLVERGFTPDEILSLITKPDYLRIQGDGAKAFIQKIGERFTIIVLNEETGKVVTALKNTTLKKIINLGKNYGWEL